VFEPGIIMTNPTRRIARLIKEAGRSEDGQAPSLLRGQEPARFLGRNITAPQAEVFKAPDLRWGSPGSNSCRWGNQMTIALRIVGGAMICLGFVALASGPPVMGANLFGFGVLTIALTEILTELRRHSIIPPPKEPSDD
jgi:hypothetical protein